MLEPLVPAVVSFVSDTVGRTQDNCDIVASYTVGKPSGLGQQIMSQKRKVESKSCENRQVHSLVCCKWLLFVLR